MHLQPASRLPFQGYYYLCITVMQHFRGFCKFLLFPRTK